MLDPRRMGRVYGAADNGYTAGVICAKVARYAERVHNPDRLTKRPAADRAEGLRTSSVRSASSEALDRAADGLRGGRGAPRRREAVWPYYYAGTMGLVQRDGINRLRHAKRYSDQYSTICTALSWAGYKAGARPDDRPRSARDGTRPIASCSGAPTRSSRRSTS